MKATEILMEEHRVIERAIDALEAGADLLERGQAVRPGFFLEAADFIRDFADGCHHAKEEDVLFNAMVAGGFPREGGPIAVMLAEHEQGRAFARSLREGAERMQNDPAAAAGVIAPARGYAALLRAHIQKEDNVLFPLAERAIAPDARDRVLEDFEKAERRIGEGVQEKHRALVDRLEAEIAAAKE